MENKILNSGSNGENLRPYEKCEAYGAAALTDAELLAVIIKTGVSGKTAVDLANDILYPDLTRPEGGMLCDAGVSAVPSCRGLSRLMHLDWADLSAIRGVGRVKTIQLLCIFELAKRLSGEKAVSGLDIRKPESVAAYYMEALRHKQEEEVHIMLLTTRCSLIASVMVSRGTVNASAVSPREIFLQALKYKAASFIAVHNHPSGNPSPSSEDIAFSKNLHMLGKIMNIPMRDSIIIGDNTYTSLLEQGLLTD